MKLNVINCLIWQLLFLILINLLINFFLYEDKPHVVVGVSGGPDSIALTFILNKWIKKNKGKLTALIIDHKIRKDSYFESLDTKKFLDFHKIF